MTVSEAATKACGRSTYVCSAIAGGSKVFDVAEDLIGRRVWVEGGDALMSNVLHPERARGSID